MSKFDDFLSGKDKKVAKYKNIRKFFSEAQTQADLDVLRRELQEAIKQKTHKEVPDDVIEFFYDERLKALGPNTSKTDSTIVSKLNAAMDQIITHQQRKARQNRPTEFGPLWYT